MSGIAELLAKLGYDVSGSDVRASPTTERLASLGIRLAIGHAADHVTGSDVVVTSSAVRSDNAEVIEARRLQIPVIPRAEMLSELMRLRFGIAVAGAHGKTSTTSMIACVLEHAGLDPTAVIGGRVAALGGNARLGQSQYMVAEADESDQSFLQFWPAIAVITNIDREHLENYRGFDHLVEAFLQFANQVPFYGAVIGCHDDPWVRDLMPRMSRRVVGYSLGGQADLMGTDAEIHGTGSRCLVRRRHAVGVDVAADVLGHLEIGVPGRHNLLNALAAVAVGLEIGLTFERIAAGLAAFQGVERRLESHGDVGGISILDDYAHHPTEIAAVLDAVEARHPTRTLVVFQPHRYSRTASLLPEFGRVLARADVVLVTEVYGAGEEPIAGIDAGAVAASIRAAGSGSVQVVESLDQIGPMVAGQARPGDVVLTLGAGSISGAAPAIARALADVRSRPWTS